ncbi:hypothetical protein EDB85DRAFT_2148476 [Lactarius pseudohatsudake]|nr:hypothetical protein EDB85DRAFT_2148476 [Lactarius pseudohatsudake]
MHADLPRLIRNSIRASTYGVVDEPPQRLLSVHAHMLHNLHICDPHEKWEITPSEESAFFGHLVGVFESGAAGNGPPLRTRTRPLARPRKAAVLDATATACAQSVPTIFGFDPLRNFDTVLAARAHSFFALQVFWTT